MSSTSGPPAPPPPAMQRFERPQRTQQGLLRRLLSDRPVPGLTNILMRLGQTCGASDVDQPVNIPRELSQDIAAYFAPSSGWGRNMLFGSLNVMDRLPSLRALESGHILRFVASVVNDPEAPLKKLFQEMSENQARGFLFETSNLLDGINSELACRYRFAINYVLLASLAGPTTEEVQHHGYFRWLLRPLQQPEEMQQMLKFLEERLEMDSLDCPTTQHFMSIMDKGLDSSRRLPAQRQLRLNDTPPYHVARKLVDLVRLLEGIDTEASQLMRWALLSRTKSIWAHARHLDQYDHGMMARAATAAGNPATMILRDMGFGSYRQLTRDLAENCRFSHKKRIWAHHPRGPARHELRVLTRQLFPHEGALYGTWNELENDPLLEPRWD
jgi:hypothetical protein